MTTPALTTREVAEKIGTDPKTLRVFLCASTDYQAPGSGARYAFTAKDVPTMKGRFSKWQADRDAAKAAKEQGEAKAS